MLPLKGQSWLRHPVHLIHLAINFQHPLQLFNHGLLADYGRWQIEQETEFG